MLKAAAALVGNAGLYLPLSAGEFVRYGAPTGTCWSHARLQQIDSDGMIADIGIYSADGGLLARFRNLRLRKRAVRESRVEESTTGIYGIDWMPAELSHNPNVLQGHWLIFGNDPVLDEEIAEHIGKQGGTSRVVAFATAANVAASDSGEREVAEILREPRAHAGTVAGILFTHQFPSLGEDGPDGLEQFQGYADALSLLQALVREQISPVAGVWFVTRNAQPAVDAAPSVSVAGRAIWALRRTAAVEFPELDTHTVDLDATGGAEDLLRIVAGTHEAEIGWRSASAWKPQLTKRMPVGTQATEEENTEIRPSPKGTIDDLLSVSVPRTEPQADEIEIKVGAHGVNFRDVMNTLGMLPGFPPQLGGECAGVVTRAGARSGYRVGDRVFAFALGSFRTFVTIPARNATKIPAHMTFAQAADIARGVSHCVSRIGSPCEAARGREDFDSLRNGRTRSCGSSSCRCPRRRSIRDCRQRGETRVSPVPGRASCVSFENRRLCGWSDGSHGRSRCECGAQLPDRRTGGEHSEHCGSFKDVFLKWASGMC